MEKRQPGKQWSVYPTAPENKRLYISVLNFPVLKSPSVLSTTVRTSPSLPPPCVAEFSLGPFLAFAPHLVFFGKWLHVLFLFFQTRGERGQHGKRKAALVFQINRGQSTSKK